MLQSGVGANTPFVSDFFDLSLYVDADPAHVREWYRDRFLALRETAFADPRSFFRRFAALDHDTAVATANDIWDTINGPNLVDNIAPTRSRAHVVLHKGHDHAVERVWLRKL